MTILFSETLELLGFVKMTIRLREKIAELTDSLRESLGIPEINNRTRFEKIHEARKGTFYRMIISNAIIAFDENAMRWVSMNLDTLDLTQYGFRDTTDEAVEGVRWFLEIMDKKEMSN